jgi:hypothetical protein
MRISISLSSRSARNLRFLELRSFAPDGAHAPDSKTLRVFSSSGRCPSHPSAHRIPERRFAPGKRSEDPNPPDAQAPDPFTVFRQRTEDAVSRKHVLYSCYPLIRITLFPPGAVPAGVHHLSNDISPGMLPSRLTVEPVTVHLRSSFIASGRPPTTAISSSVGPESAYTIWPISRSASSQAASSCGRYSDGTSPTSALFIARRLSTRATIRSWAAGR